MLEIDQILKANELSISLVSTLLFTDYKEWSRGLGFTPGGPVCECRSNCVREAVTHAAATC